MKISNAQTLRSREPLRADVYAVRSPRGIITVIDNEENILDLFQRTSLRYTISEAEELVDYIKGNWEDFEEDPYYLQGKPLYPIYQPPKKLKVDEIERMHYSSTITTYRYKLAGEWVYGITNSWAEIEEGKHERAIEAPMDGWEKWLDDRKAMLKDKWIAEHGGNL